MIFGRFKLDLEVLSLLGNFKGCVGQKRLNAPSPSLNFFQAVCVPFCGPGTDGYKTTFFGLAAKQGLIAGIN